MSKILLKGMRITNGIFRCDYCGGTIEDGDIYVSRRNKVYKCITCAEVLNMVTADEIKDSIEKYKDVNIVKAKVITHSCGEGIDQIEFTLAPVDKKEIKKIVKSRADIKNDLGIRKRYRHKRFRRR